jgi:hypothetical protein
LAGGAEGTAFPLFALIIFSERQSRTPPQGEQLMSFHHLQDSGNLVVDTCLDLSVDVLGSITVTTGGHLRFGGTCHGDLVIECGGKCLLSGRVSGNAVNQGGVLVVEGIVEGALIRRGGLSFWTREASIGRLAASLPLEPNSSRLETSSRTNDASGPKHVS